MSEKIEIEVLKCQECNFIEPVPVHCGKPMVLEEDTFVCWRGEHAPCCGRSSKMSIPKHHDKPMILRRAMAEKMANGQFLIHDVL